MVSMSKMKALFSRKVPLIALADNEPAIIADEDADEFEFTKGTATILAGDTSVTIPHGQSVQPTLSQIQVTPTNIMGDATKFWISNIGSVNFKINTDIEPGVGNDAEFVWTCSPTPVA